MSNYITPPPSFKALSGMGAHLVPIRPGGKLPAAKWKDPESCTPAHFDELAATFPETTAWGLLCGRSGLLVIDIDRHGDSDGFEALGSVYLDLLLDDPLVVTTPSNGQHLYFRLPDGVTMRGIPGPKWHKGVDVKSDGGYVLAPGSRTNAGTYNIVGGDVSQLPEAPMWLLAELDELQAPPVEPKPDRTPMPPRLSLEEPLLRRILGEVANLPAGERNTPIFRKTRVLIEHGLLNQYTEELLLEAAIFSGHNPDHARTAINSAKDTE